MHFVVIQVKDIVEWGERNTGSNFYMKEHAYSDVAAWTYRSYVYSFLCVLCVYGNVWAYDFSIEQPCLKALLL